MAQSETIARAKIGVKMKTGVEVETSVCFQYTTAIVACLQRRNII